MEDWSNPIASVSDTLLHSGYAVVRLSGAFLDALDGVFDAADAYFDWPHAKKAAYALPEALEGYRALGAEFSMSADRPDLNETFAMAPRNARRPEVADWVAGNPLYAALTRAERQYVDLADRTLDGIRRRIDPNGDRIRSAAFSYFQLNHYRPARETRDLLQDAHEDGHLLTIVTSRQEGLEIEVDGQFEPAGLSRDEVLVMPGSILTLMTGGEVQPLPHRVRNAPGVARRASLMFFVNPDLANPPRAWAPAVDGSWPDIRAATIETSQVFGLASIEALAQ